jgi:hypothetical protein
MSNPFGQFIGVSPHMLQNMKGSASNFNQTFQPNTTILERQDYTNTGNVIHNNLHHNLLNEHIIDYNLCIDTADSNKTHFPSPFYFQIYFGDNQNEMSITQKFTNVKYVKIDYVILPNTSVVNISSDPDPVYSISPTGINNGKFIAIKLKELSNGRTLSTNPKLSNDCIILCFDRKIGTNRELWLPLTPLFAFKNSDLANVKRLTVELVDDTGNLMFTTDQNGNRFDVYSKLIELRSSKAPTDPILVAFEEIYKVLQMSVGMTIGSVENELNTMTSYNQ